MGGLRGLLRLFPASFRTEYGGEMLALLGDRRRRLSRWQVPGFWIGAVADLLGNALRVHGDLLRQDLGYTARSFRRAPGFAATAVAIAALGIGAATAAFSLADRVLLRPLPFVEPERLVQLWGTEPGYRSMELSPANYRDLREASRSFDRIAAFHPQSANLVGVGRPQRLDGVAATADFFELLGVRAHRGRVLGEEDEAPGAPDAVVLDHGLWQRELGGDPGAIGRTVRLDDAAVTIVGVMPPGFDFPSRQVSFWRALRFSPNAFEERSNSYLKALARLAPGVEVESAGAEVGRIAERIDREYPDQTVGLRGSFGARVVPLREELSRGSRLPLVTLFAASLCVLLVACTNLAGLLVVRAMGRRRELAMRAALGAGRERIVRQLLTESLVLAGCGGVLGLLLAAAAVPLLSGLIPESVPSAGAALLDPRMAAFAALLTLATGIGFGVGPALRLAGGSSAVEGLGEGPRGGIGGRRQRSRSLLVVAQVAASVVLLVAVGLLLRALATVESVDPGFSTDDVLALETALPMTRYAETSRRAALYDRILAEVRALPGVVDAGYISFLPMVMRGGIWPVEIAASDDDAPDTASLRFVTPGYFDTLRIPILAGRDVAVSDEEGRTSVAVVSRSFAERYWPGADPIGRTFGFAYRERTVAGVVGDVMFRGLERTSEPQVYLPYRQVPDGAVPFYAPKHLAVRASSSPLTLVPAIREIVRRADPELPIANVRLLDDLVAAEIVDRRTQLAVLGTFAALALGLAGIGLYGLLSSAVGQRRGEIGVRMALGADPATILGMVLGRGLGLAALGGAVGAVAAYGAGRGMEALLAGVPPGDPIAFAAALGVALAMTLVGSLQPALRAVRVDPSTALRAE